MPKLSPVAAGKPGQACVSGLRMVIEDGLKHNNPRFAMSEPDNIPKPERVPFFQRVLDNPFLLLFLGIVMPTVFYILWGIMEIATLPVAP